MIEYRESADGIEPSQLHGFFVDWPVRPSPELHLDILKGSAHVVLALDDQLVVSFVNAISDGVVSAFIPLLEVLPQYQGRGIGSELMNRMLGRLESLYMVDLCCDADLEPFYTRHGMTVLDRGMGVRRPGTLAELPREIAADGR
jgi:ribosomal protein S18 acetylase RimI-like enzyme